MSEDTTTPAETTSSIFTMFASTRRDRRWYLTDEVLMSTYAGTATFDMRQAEGTGGDEIEIFARCVLGAILIIVPPGTRVTMDGQTVVGRATCDIEGDGESGSLPRINITASSYFGRIRVCTPDRLTGRMARAAAPVEAAPGPGGDGATDVAEPAPTGTEASTVDEPRSEPDAA